MVLLVQGIFVMRKLYFGQMSRHLFKTSLDKNAILQRCSFSQKHTVHHSIKEISLISILAVDISRTVKRAVVNRKLGLEAI